MKARQFGKYLMAKGIETRGMNAEQKVNAVLEELAKEKANFKEGKFRSHLIGISTLIAHFLPRKPKEPEKMLRNLAEAYSRRGYCIFDYEPVESAFARLIGESKKTPKGLREVRKVLAHSNASIRNCAVSSLKSHPDLVQRFEKDLFGEVNGSDEMRSRLNALKSSAKMAEKNSALLIRGLKSYTPAIQVKAIELFWNSPKLAKSMRITGLLPKGTNHLVEGMAQAAESGDREGYDFARERLALLDYIEIGNRWRPVVVMKRKAVGDPKKWMAEIGGELKGELAEMELEDLSAIVSRMEKRAKGGEGKRASRKMLREIRKAVAEAL